MDANELSQFERINVVGTSGSGKTTFARELAEVLDLPCYEMDQMYWKAGWQSASDDELLDQVRDATSHPKWILDGNYTRTIPCKWETVQLVIWLDLSFARTVWRVTRRAFKRSLNRTEIWPGTGNRESLFNAFLTKDSVIWWAITSYGDNKEKYSDLMQSSEFSHIQFLRLTTPSSVTSCLEALRRHSQTAQQ